MLTLKIVVFVLLFLLPALQVVRDWKYHDKRTRNFHRVTKIILTVYVLLVVPSTYFLWMDIQKGRRLQGYLTGGDSYCYVNLLPENGNTFQIIIVNEGEYPIPDVSIRMVDRQKFGPPGSESADSLMRATTVLNLDRMPAARAVIMGEGNYPTSDKQDFIIFIEAQNRSVLEYFSSRRVEERWVSAYKIMSKDEKETLLQRSDPAFPRDTSGQIQW
jgi:hypothetical protein